EGRRQVNPGWRSESFAILFFQALLPCRVAVAVIPPVAANLASPPRRRSGGRTPGRSETWALLRRCGKRRAPAGAAGRRGVRVGVLLCYFQAAIRRREAPL